MAKIAVTGSTGFIGTHLVNKLLKEGHTIYPIGRDFRKVECDVIYHLACPSTTTFIDSNTTDVMDIIMDGTRKALAICPGAYFINASSYGAEFIDNSPQGAYNVAKRCMEVYLNYSTENWLNYRIPSVYGPGAPRDSFIQRCIDGTAYVPTEPDKLHYIAHIDDVVEALVTYMPIPIEKITLGEIYGKFSK